MMPYISGLRADIWAQSSPEAKLQAINQMEFFLASQDGRTPSLILSEQLPSNVRGTRDIDCDVIRINSTLIDQDHPYQAVETFFHEDRHSQQAFVVQHPEKAENQQQLDDWSMSFNNGYVQPDDYDYAVYRWQPTETDANKIARLKTNDLYQNTFYDDQKYPDYRVEKELEIADDITEAQDKLGDDYEQAARQKMVHKYQTMQAEYQNNDLSVTDQNPITQENVEVQQYKSPSIEFENSGEQTNTPGNTPEDRADIKFIGKHESASLDNRQSINQPGEELKNEISLPAQTEGEEKTGSSDEISYEQGYYR